MTTFAFADCAHIIRLLHDSGWKHAVESRDYGRDADGAPDGPWVHEHTWSRDGQEVRVTLWDGEFQSCHWQDEVGDDSFWGFGQGIGRRLTRQRALDMLVAVGALPVTLSSTFDAGRASVGRLIEADTTTEYESTHFYADGTSDNHGYSGPDPATLRAWILERAAGDVEDPRWDCVRVEVRSYEQHTYRVNEQVIGTFTREVSDAR